LVVVKPKLGIEPRFLLWYLRSDSIISQADEATRSIGVPDLGIKRIREFHMPRPSIDEQRRIVAELDALQMQVDSLQDLQAETSAELDALMPSILDKAFRGKL
jgi:type I restriction enzyme S subunit